MAAPVPRRSIAIKHGDGEPLTRADIQYDVLHAIFSDKHEVFTDPFAAKDAPKLTFKDLYLKSIVHSPKATKALKDKMNESEEFGEDYAMLSLLVNVGRINTTMSFFPEMKTAIRTYHPVPSLQRTSGNLQDAPRIKHVLRAIQLDDIGEVKLGYPASLAEVVARYQSGTHPPTNIANLIFVLASHSTPVGESHFNSRLEFIDLFMRRDISSASRGRAFLWLCYNYLESPTSEEDDYDSEPTTNPFSDSEDQASPPSFHFLTPEETAEENKESPEDLLMTEKLLSQRTRILRTQSAKEAGKGSTVASINGSVMGDDEEPPVLPEDESKGRNKRTTSTVTAPAKGKTKRAPAKKSVPLTAPVVMEKAKEPEPFPIPDLDDDDQLYDAFVRQRELSRRNGHGPITQNAHRFDAASDTHAAQPHRQWYTPYPQNHRRPVSPNRSRHRTYHHRAQPPRSMFQQAWQVIESDPLIDSDEEGGDEYVREDCIQRLKVLNQLSQQRWMPDLRQPSDMDTDSF